MRNHHERVERQEFDLAPALLNNEAVKRPRAVRDSLRWLESGEYPSVTHQKQGSDSRVVVLAPAPVIRGEASSAEDSGKDRIAELNTSWQAYLQGLTSRAESGNVSKFQASFVRDTWLKLIRIVPNVIYPTAGSTEDGDLYMTWNRLGVTLTVEVHRSAASWFFADEGTGDFDGSEDDTAELPPRVLTLLRLFQR